MEPTGSNLPEDTQESQSGRVCLRDLICCAGRDNEGGLGV